MVQQVKIADVTPGMVLSEDVVSQNGRSLLSGGNTLSEKHIKIFKSWGVPDVLIEEGEQCVKAGDPPADLASHPEIERELKKLFSHTDLRHPVIKELFDLALVRKIKAVS